MSKELFAVVVFHSFDPDAYTYLFDSEEEANVYAKTLWLETYATEAKESVDGVDPERSYWDDEASEGEIYWDDPSEPDYIRFFVTPVTDKRSQLMTN